MKKDNVGDCNGKVCFSDLSLDLKVLVVVGWVSLALYGIAFLIGFMIGFMGL